MREPWVRFLAWSEVLAGVAGVLSLLWAMAVYPQALPAWYVLLALSFFGANVVAGYWLLRRRSKGVPLSFAVQVLQVLVLNVGVAYVARAGIHLTAVVASTGAGLFAGPSATFAATPADTGGLDAFGLGYTLNIGWWLKPIRESHWALGVNVVALFFAIRLWPSSLWSIEPEALPATPSARFKWGVPAFTTALFIVAGWLTFGGSWPKPKARWALANGDTVEILVYNNQYDAGYRVQEKTVDARHYLWVQFRSDLADVGKDHRDAVAIAQVACPQADSMGIHRVLVQPSQKRLFGLVTYSRSYWFDAGPAPRCEERSRSP